MFTPKVQLQKTLSSLGYYCHQGAQASFSGNEIPAITFRVDNNSVNLDLSNEIASQDINVVVDIWADDSITASQVLSGVEEVMRLDGYQMTYSADVSQPKGCLFHINCRFITVHVE